MNDPAVNASLAQALAALNQDRDRYSWQERRRLAMLARAALREEREEAAALGIAQLLAGDKNPKVRKVIADLLSYLPDHAFVPLAAKLTEDHHSLVRKSAERALVDRRRSARAAARQKEDLEQIEGDYERMEKVHGPVATAKARRMAERSYELLIGTAVHDMRRVLTPIQRNLTALLDHLEREAPNPNLLRTGLGRIKGRMDFLVRLVDNMQTISQEIPRERQVHKLRDVIAEARSMVLDGLKDQNLEAGKVLLVIEVPEDLTVNIAGFHFTRAIANVLENAFQAILEDDSRSDPGEVAVIASRLPDQGVQIVVRDNGPGMSEEVLREAFLPCRTTRINRGTGCGLTIARRAVVAHGGTIGLESQVGTGTTVTIVLPVETEDEE